MWEVKAVHSCISPSAKAHGYAEGRSSPVPRNGYSLSLNDQLTPASEQCSTRIIAAGNTAQLVVESLQVEPHATDIYFSQRTKTPEQAPCDFAIFVGCLQDLAQLNAGVRQIGDWTWAIILDATCIADAPGCENQLFNYERLLFAGDADVGKARDLIDMLLALTVRHGMVGTDWADVRRVFTRQGECRFHCRRGSGVANIRAVIDAMVQDAEIDSRTTGVVALIAGPELTIEDFVYLNEKVIPVVDQTEILITMKEFVALPNEAIAAAVWTISDGSHSG